MFYNVPNEPLQPNQIRCGRCNLPIDKEQFSGPEVLYFCLHCDYILVRDTTTAEEVEVFTIYYELIESMKGPFIVENHLKPGTPGYAVIRYDEIKLWRTEPAIPVGMDIIAVLKQLKKSCTQITE